MRQPPKLRGRVVRVKHTLERIECLVVLPVLQGKDAKLKEVRRI